jgi:hypothetical protein
VGRARRFWLSQQFFGLLFEALFGESIGQVRANHAVAIDEDKRGGAGAAIAKHGFRGDDHRNIGEFFVRCAPHFGCFRPVGCWIIVVVYASDRGELDAASAIFLPETRERGLLSQAVAAIIRPQEEDGRLPSCGLPGGSIVGRDHGSWLAGERDKIAPFV